MATNGHRASTAETLIAREGAHTQRMKSAATRALHDQARLRQNVVKLNEALDDATPGPRRNVEFTEEDSLVTSITALLEQKRDE